MTYTKCRVRIDLEPKLLILILIFLITNVNIKKGNYMSELITQSTVIEMGFTKSMITRLLPPPIERPNPHYKCAAPMKLWEKDEVLKVMNTKAYEEMAKKVKKRKAAAKKAAITKAENLQINMSEIGKELKITIIADEELVRKTLKDREQYIILGLESQIDCLLYKPSKYMTEEDTDELNQLTDQLDDLKKSGIGIPNIDTLNRWIVNYIRHNLVEYDTNLKHLYGKTGKQSGYETFKKVILEKIAELYPKYKDECERQIENIAICKY